MKFKGLDKKEVAEKFKKYGPNEISDIGKVSWFKLLFRQVSKNFVIYLLFFAALLSLFVGKSVTAYAIFGVIILVVSVGFIQEYKAEKAISALKQMLVPISILIRNGKEIEVSSKEIVPDDIIVLRSGEKIPADCIVLEERDLYVNESILTGESKEVRKVVPKTLSDYKDDNLLFMGSFVVNGHCFAKVLRTGMNTKFGNISKLISTTEKALPLQDKVNKISKYMVIVAIIASLLTGSLMLLRVETISQEILIEILILVIALSVSAFPEGLPVVLITTLASGAYRMSQNNAIVNRMSIIETLGETTVICSDKTGTITKGEMTVRKVFCDNNLLDVTGVGYEAEGNFTLDGKKIDVKKYSVLNLMLKTAVLCNDANISKTGEDKTYHVIGNPTEAALAIMAAKANIFIEDFNLERTEELPFSSERKMMSVFYHNKDDYIYSKGAFEILINKCSFIQRNNGVFRFTAKDKERISNLNAQMNKDGLRTLSLAYKNVKSFKKDHFEEDLIFLGLVGMEDPPKKEVKDAIKVCFNAGISVKMITGDSKDTAVSIGKQIGLVGKVLEGYQIDKLDDEQFSNIIQNIVIFARVKPEHKIRIVQILKAKGEIVTMTGDGVNDAPALKEAHIGVAMGKGGTDVSKSVADLTLKDDNFATIVHAIREGRTIFNDIRKFVSYQLSCNYAELSILFIGVLLAPFLGWQIPILLALQILFMNLVTDDLPAITLGLTPSSDDIMKEKPRRKTNILNKPILIWTVISGFAMAFLTIASFYVSFNIFGQSTEFARTTALVSLICLEIANAYNFMSFRRQVVFSSLTANIYLFYASIISIFATLAIVYTPLNKVFETVPLNLNGWIIAISMSLIILILMNILKKIHTEKKWLNLN